MTTYTIAQADGATARVEGRRFAHYIGGIRYWFLIHQGEGSAFKAVTELSTGRRVGHLSYASLSAARRDELVAAKVYLDKLVADRGPDTVRQAIDAAPKITDKWSA